MREERERKTLRGNKSHDHAQVEQGLNSDERGATSREQQAHRIGRAHRNPVAAQHWLLERAGIRDAGLVRNLAGQEANLIKDISETVGGVPDWFIPGSGIGILQETGLKILSDIVKQQKPH